MAARCQFIFWLVKLSQAINPGPSMAHIVTYSALAPWRDVERRGGGAALEENVPAGSTALFHSTPLSFSLSLPFSVSISKSLSLSSALSPSHPSSSSIVLCLCPESLTPSTLLKRIEKALPHTPAERNKLQNGI